MVCCYGHGMTLAIAHLERWSDGEVCNGLLLRAWNDSSHCSSGPMERVEQWCSAGMQSMTLVIARLDRWRELCNGFVVTGMRSMTFGHCHA
jgi:hypothetical protein